MVNQGNLSNVRRITEPCVAHFIKELTDEAAPAVLVPLSYLAWLYESWRIWRGIDDLYQLRDRRAFTHVLCHLSPDLTGVQPLGPSFPVTRHAIRVVELRLAPESKVLVPNPPLRRANDTAAIGVSSGPFVWGDMHSIPVHIATDIHFIAGYVARKKKHLV